MLSAMASMMAAVNPGDAKAQMELFAAVGVLLKWPVLAFGGMSAWLGYQRQGVLAAAGRATSSDSLLWVCVLVAAVSFGWWFVAGSGA